MGMLRIISCRGDDRRLWNEQDALAGDAEAIAALREVERIFAQERARGATAFRVEAGKPVERLGQFDPQATQIIMVPRVVGGGRWTRWSTWRSRSWSVYPWCSSGGSIHARSDGHANCCVPSSPRSNTATYSSGATSISPAQAIHSGSTVCHELMGVCT